MLYLMMSKTNDLYLVKVGYSNGPKNLRQRRSAYYSYNPLAIMRSSCAGSRELESDCHSQLIKNNCVRIKGTEWFVVPKEVFNLLYSKGMGAFYPNHKPIHFLEEFEKGA